jgi:hypothetical protein
VSDFYILFSFLKVYSIIQVTSNCPQCHVIVSICKRYSGFFYVNQSANNKNPAAKLLQQPSISITPLPRQPTGIAPGNPAHGKHGTHPSGKATFVICEICDGYIKVQYVLFLMGRL